VHGKRQGSSFLGTQGTVDSTMFDNLTIRWFCPTPVTDEVSWHNSGYRRMGRTCTSSISGEYRWTVVAPEHEAASPCSTSLISASLYDCCRGAPLSVCGHALTASCHYKMFLFFLSLSQKLFVFVCSSRRFFLLTSWVTGAWSKCAFRISSVSPLAHAR